jgi:hypothetical protein
MSSDDFISIKGIKLMMGHELLKTTVEVIKTPLQAVFKIGTKMIAKIFPSV